jgi:hypothetical protein
MVRVDEKDRGLWRHPRVHSVMHGDKAATSFIPKENYISIMSAISNEDGVLITDQLGRPLSPDRRHLTKYGAIFLGSKIFTDSKIHTFLSEF